MSLSSSASSKYWLESNKLVGLMWCQSDILHSHFAVNGCHAASKYDEECGLWNHISQRHSYTYKMYICRQFYYPFELQFSFSALLCSRRYISLPVFAKWKLVFHTFRTFMSDVVKAHFMRSFSSLITINKWRPLYQMDLPVKWNFHFPLVRSVYKSF